MKGFETHPKNEVQIFAISIDREGWPLQSEDFSNGYRGKLVLAYDGKNNVHYVVSGWANYNLTHDDLESAFLLNGIDNLGEHFDTSNPKHRISLQGRGILTIEGGVMTASDFKYNQDKGELDLDKIRGPLDRFKDRHDELTDVVIEEESVVEPV
jgi:hypothetical protein